jgi:hypothetical protein
VDDDSEGWWGFRGGEGNRGGGCQIWEAFRRGSEGCFRGRQRGETARRAPGAATWQPLWCSRQAWGAFRAEFSATVCGRTEAHE